MYTWNSLGQLVQAAMSNSPTITYGYDGLGRRVRRTPSSGAAQQYVYDGDNLWLETDANGTVLREYGFYPGVDHPFTVRTGGDTIFYFQQDGTGNVNGLLRSDGTIDRKIIIDPFGTVADTSAPLLGFGFKGREHDTQTGLVYMRSRWYDPELARFVSEDPIGLDGGLNSYSLAGNDPINGADPLGLSATPQCFTFLAEFGGTVNGRVDMPPRYVTICLPGENSAGGGGIGFGPWHPTDFERGGGSTIGPMTWRLPAPEKFHIRVSTDPACYAAGAYFFGNALIDYTGAREVAEGLRLAGAGVRSLIRSWGTSIIREQGRTFGRVDQRVLEGAGRAMIGAGAPAVAEHVTDDLKKGAIYQEASFWSVVGAFVPGVSTASALREANEICHSGGE